MIQCKFIEKKVVFKKQMIINVTTKNINNKTYTIMMILDNVPQTDLSTLVSQVVGEKNMKLVLNRMSAPSVVESLQKGKLKGIPQEMKLSRSKFFHGYTEDKKELIVQVSPEKIAVFY